MAWAVFRVLGRLNQHGRPAGSQSKPVGLTLHIGRDTRVRRLLERQHCTLPEQDGRPWSRPHPTRGRESPDIEADFAVLGVVAGMRGEELHATIVGKTYDARFMLHGLAQHVAYHAGQIALLAKTGPEVARGLLRHTLAVLAYRGGKVLRDSPEGFAHFGAGGGTRTPLQVLSHIGDLFEWCVSLADGGIGGTKRRPTMAEPCARFHAGLRPWTHAFSTRGPWVLCRAADPGTHRRRAYHIGQISLMRRLAGSP